VDVFTFRHLFPLALSLSRANCQAGRILSLSR
jgi:hypothetical protein